MFISLKFNVLCGVFKSFTYYGESNCPITILILQLANGFHSSIYQGNVHLSIL
jgi:hypothetical protein